MKKYIIILRNEEGMVALTISFFALFFAECYFQKTPGGRFLLGIPTLSILIFLLVKFTIAKTEWEITEEGITMKWITKLPFQKNNDLFIKWNEVKGYKDIFGKGWNLFKIKLKNGNTLRFPHGSLFYRDNFYAFYEAFHVMFLTLNNPEQLSIGYKLKKQ